MPCSTADEACACTCRLFLYENIPQLRYHNPAIHFHFEAHQETESQLLLSMGECAACTGQHAASQVWHVLADGGRTEPIVTTGLRQKEIRMQIENFIEKNLAVEVSS